MPKVVGIYGGSFNPPHYGHLLTGITVLQKQLVDQVVYVPVNKHPDGKNLAPFNDRLEMCIRMVQGFVPFRVSDIELEIPGVSYSIKTVKAIISEYNGIHTRPENRCSFRFIVGYDCVLARHTWGSNWNEINSLAPVLPVSRLGLEAKDEEYKPIELITQSSISSTEVRNRVKQGLPVDNLVPKAIEKYIHEKGLYINNG